MASDIPADQQIPLGAKKDPLMWEWGVEGDLFNQHHQNIFCAVQGCKLVSDYPDGGRV